MKINMEASEGIFYMSGQGKVSCSSFAGWLVIWSVHDSFALLQKAGLGESIFGTSPWPEFEKVCTFKTLDNTPVL